jgi:hypothetical protein
MTRDNFQAEEAEWFTQEELDYHNRAFNDYLNLHRVNRMDEQAVQVYKDKYFKKFMG